MDIVLQTNTDNPSLAFRDLERFDDDSGYGTTLVIHSGWISVEYKFVFETLPLQMFLKNLEQIDRTLIGTARLKPTYEEQFVEFEGNGRGHILVHGELADHSGGQRVRFGFGADQTCLRPFIVAFQQFASCAS